jgi:hypothetical protein
MMKSGNLKKKLYVLYSYKIILEKREGSYFEFLSFRGKSGNTKKMLKSGELEKTVCVVLV